MLSNELPNDAFTMHCACPIAALIALLAFSSLALTTNASAQDGHSADKVVCSYDAYNCGDFSSCSQVMRVFEACDNDVHRLDRDKDGVPCESLCK